ncbi:YbhB/YbcL family Raf kinase inhibitor-like protein [Candidatus Roizmanbacteria bacterium]|nr:YbhB/YbcL family Raf kinase inhibitor-like protein [Candidatus Roizmanbacteria bacterium]
MIKVASAAFKNGEIIPKKYTCDGENINPPLTIASIPAEAKSLALIVDDPDAPVGNWNHWLVWNIEPATKEISENSVPANTVLGINDFGKLEYGGPCPPSGTHRYFFRIYALDTKLDLPQGAKRGELENAMKNHIVDQGELMGKYSR